LTQGFEHTPSRIYGVLSLFYVNKGFTVRNISVTQAGFSNCLNLITNRVCGSNY